MIGLLIRNFWWKMAALAIAVAVWIAVANEPEVSAFVSVPVEYRNLPDSLEISSPVVETVELQLRGSSGELRAFNTTRTAVVLDMAGEQPGQRTYTIGGRDVHLPRALTLIRAIPSEVRFRFERHKETAAPVEVKFTSPPEKFQVTPATLTIAGPESHVNRIKGVTTDEIDTANLTGTGTFHVNAFVNDPYVRILPDPEVTVEVWMKDK